MHLYYYYTFHEEEVEMQVNKLRSKNLKIFTNA